MVDSREERVAKNEAMHRAVNREIEQVAEDLGERGANTIEVLCECGQPGCTSLLSLTIGDYDRVHGQRDRFIVAQGHVVYKFGEAEATAEEEERREGTN
jgi:predicted nuclease with RNAse H fold